MKICYKIELVESIGRYNTLQTTTRAFVVEPNNGFYAIQKAMMGIENMVRFRVVECFPVTEVDLNTDFNEESSIVANYIL